MVPFEDGPFMFIFLCFVTRILNAVGATAASISTYAIATNVFRASAGSAMVSNISFVQPWPI